MQASGKGNIMGMLLKKQSVLLTLMDLRVRVNVFDLEVWIQDQLPDTADVVLASFL